MLSALLLFLQLAVTIPPAVIVHANGRDHSVPVVTTRGKPTVSATKLAAAIGGTLHKTSAGHYTLTVGDSRIEFTGGALFVKVDSTITPVASPPVIVSDVLYVPFQVVTDIIPHLVTGFIYDAPHDELREFDTTAARVPVSETTAATAASAESASTDTQNSSPARDVTATHPHSHVKHLVVVDAGHGGPDNGMTGTLSNGTRFHEKDITLAVAKLVAKTLRDDGLNVLMTRTTDTLIALSDRGRIANQHHGDLFVSVHVNATGSRGPDGVHDRGYETYFLAEAKTEEALRVERMENQSVKFETGANAPKGDPLSYIINDMAQNEHLRESSDLAETIQDGFRSFHPGPNRGVQQANFAVLRDSFMPAVLVEIGFGTNPSEAAFITNSDNERTIARSIAHSIETYLDGYDARVGAGK